MLTMYQPLCPRSRKITTRLLNGKTMIVNLATGKCYSTEKVGGLIWQMICRRHSLEETIAATLEQYEVGREQAYREVVHFAAELFRQNLIGVSANGRSAAQAPRRKQRQRQTYEMPILNVYNTMGERLPMNAPVAASTKMERSQRHSITQGQQATCKR